MNRLHLLSMIVLLVSCSPATIPAPEIPDQEATLISSNPSIEIAFNGDNCTILSNEKITTGDTFLLFHNLNPQPAYIRVGRIYPGYSWDDFLKWYADNCGSPGSECAGGEPPWISWLFPEEMVGHGEEKAYYRYQLIQEAEYLTFVERPDGSVWPCAAFAASESR